MRRGNTQTSDVREAASGVRDAVASTALPPDAASEAHAIVNQLDDYILPCLANLDAPLLAVLGGSTGSGKSAFVNALLRERVSNPGVIRPTTRQPVLVAHPDDADWFKSPQVLPGLARSHGAGDEHSTTLRIVGTPRIPDGLVLLDALDFDSIDNSLPAELDRAVARTTLPAEPSKGWGLLTVFQWLALLAALVGVLWYLAVAFLPGVLTPLLGGDWVPDVEGWPIPTLLIMAGVLTGLLIGLLSAVFGGVLGSGVKRRTRSAVQKQVAAVSQTAVAEPLLAIREDYSRFAERIAVALGK